MTRRTHGVKLATGTDAGITMILVTRDPPEIIDQSDYFSDQHHQLAVGMEFRVLSGPHADESNGTIQAPWEEARFVVQYSDKGNVKVRRRTDWTREELEIQGRLKVVERASGKVDLVDDASGVVFKSGIRAGDAEVWLNHFASKPADRMTVRWVSPSRKYGVYRGDELVTDGIAVKEEAEALARGDQPKAA
jgi:hypothetical protein